MKERKNRLLIFPHAGGNEIPYRGLMTQLSDLVEVKIVCYPGRGKRMAEPLNSDFFNLVEDALNTLKGWEDASCRLFFLGHSFGSLVAFETLRRLRSLGRTLPYGLIFSAASGPSNPDRDRTCSQKTDAELISLLQLLGGMDQELLASREFLDYFLPVFRSDLKAMDDYQYRAAAPFELPFWLMNGQSDVGIQPNKLKLWQQETTLPCDYRQYEGGHFYLFTSGSALADLKKILT